MKNAFDELMSEIKGQFFAHYSEHNLLTALKSDNYEYSGKHCPQKGNAFFSPSFIISLFRLIRELEFCDEPSEKGHLTSIYH